MRKDEKNLTVATYEENATGMAEYFRGKGARVEDINRAFAMTGNHEPKVVEIGCGDGRDAQEILKHTSRYKGFDISPAMIEMAKSINPKGDFVVGDVFEFDFGHNNDLVLAFASLLHSSKEELKKIFEHVYSSLNNDGIFYISLKRAPYGKVEKKDSFGVRYFYMYKREDIESIASDNFETIYYDEQSLGSTDWLTIVFRKQLAHEVPNEPR